MAPPDTHETRRLPSPKRAPGTRPGEPLHQRSDSQSNQSASPTIRLVRDDSVYSKTPFPTRPSHVLLPARNAPGYAFESRPSVSDAANPPPALVPKPLQPRRAARQSTSTGASDADTTLDTLDTLASSCTPASSRLSQSTTPSSPPECAAVGLGIEAPSSVRAVSASPRDDVTPKASAASLASSDTFVYHAHDPQTSGSDIAQPPGPEAATQTDAQARPSTQASNVSALSGASSERPRSGSLPSVHDARHVRFTSGLRPVYPLVRPPSSSSREPRILKNPARMQRSHAPHQWSSQLSTIASESDRGSRSVERSSFPRSSQSVGRRSAQGQAAARSGPPGHAASAEHVSTEASESSVSVPLPLFSPRVASRDSDEHQDQITPLQPPPLRKKRSGLLRRQDSDSRSSSRPSSSQSERSTLASSALPAWARVYYRRGEAAQLAPPDTPSETGSVRMDTGRTGQTNTPPQGNFPLSIYRPRNRPLRASAQTDSALSEAEAAVEPDLYAIPPARRRMDLLSPRLRTDRRSGAGLSAWKAPSLDGSLRGLFFARHNRQLLLFCVGFLFPPAWILASMLPLPSRVPAAHDVTPSQVDFEQHLAQVVGPLEDRAYQKAMWWRNLNRVMSGIGTLLIGVIIALSIVASRMQ